MSEVEQSAAAPEVEQREKRQVTFRMTAEEAGYFARFRAALEAKAGKKFTDKELVFKAIKTIFH